MNSQILVAKTKKLTQTIKDIQVSGVSFKEDEIKQIQNEINDITENVSNPTLPCLEKLVDIAKVSNFDIAKLNEKIKKNKISFSY